MTEYDDEAAGLRLQRDHERRMRNAMARYPDPRDPDHPGGDEEPEVTPCPWCGMPQVVPGKRTCGH